MTKTVYKEDIPANARITIDYTKDKKDRVEFSYPREWTYRKAVWHCAFTTILSFFFMVHLVLFVLFLIVYQVYLMMTTPLSMSVSTGGNLFLLLPYFLILLYMIGVPALVTLLLSLNKERLGRWIPKLGHWSFKLIGYRKEKTFLPNEVKYKKVAIPFFYNIFLHYKPTGEFRKYLERVEVRELPFFVNFKIFFLPFIKRKTWNDMAFSAVFYFSEKPKTGDLRVDFI